MATNNALSAVLPGTTLRFPDHNDVIEGTAGLTWSFFDGNVDENAILAPNSEQVHAVSATLSWTFDESQAGRITLRVKDSDGRLVADRALDAAVTRVEANVTLKAETKQVLTVALKFE